MASNFSPWSLAAAPISGAFQYAGGKAQAGAEKEAAQLQHQTAEEALADARKLRDWQQQQYSNYLGQQQAFVNRMQPYNQMGMQAGQTLGGLLARSPYAGYAQTGTLPKPQQFTLPASSIGSLIAKS